MSPPEKSPTPKPVELRPNQVPWGTPKPAVSSPKGPPATPPAPLPVPEPAVPEPALVVATLSAKKVPWGARKPPATPLPLASDPSVTHMPWGTRSPIPGISAPPPEPVTPTVVSAKKVPWSWRKTPKPAAPEKKKTDETSPRVPSWALPKGAAAEIDAQAEMEFAREMRAATDREPTAEQLVAYLSRLTARRKDQPVSLDPLTPYKARPISFEPTPWEILKMRAYVHRLRLSVGGVALVLLLGLAYLLRLVSLNTAIDREWLAMSAALHERYALAPGYVACITSFSANERYTLTLTELGLKAWRSARTEEEVVAAAARMERVMSHLSKVMKRCELEVPAPDPEQLESSAAFAQLEKLREQSRTRTSAIVRRYNTAVANFNDQVDGFPGVSVAWIARLQPRVPIFGGIRE